MLPLLISCLFVCGELVSLTLTGSPTPGARIASGLLAQAGPFGMALAGAAEGIAAVGERSRALTAEEYTWAGRVFARALPPRERLVLTDTIGPGGRAFTFPRVDGKITLNMGGDSFADPRVHAIADGMRPGEMFVHELTHAWQLHRGGLGPRILAAIAASRIRELGGGDPYRYTPGQPFVAYDLEQQAQIVSDWYRRHRRALRSAAARRDPLYRYVHDDLRGE